MNGENNYIPSKGDIVYINFDPSRGKEIRKRRPALVISNQKYSRLTGLAAVCPITSADSNRLVDMGIYISFKAKSVYGYVNPLQFHTFDYQRRGMEFVETIGEDELNEVLARVIDVIDAEEP